MMRWFRLKGKVEWVVICTGLTFHTITIIATAMFFPWWVTAGLVVAVITFYTFVFRLITKIRCADVEHIMRSL